jgi:hypothetical protein
MTDTVAEGAVVLLRSNNGNELRKRGIGTTEAERA